MIANFALSLSFEGIKLLQRVADGWHVVGETRLDVPDLGAALAQMRADALVLSPEGIQTKVLLPAEQIKFITLETAQTSLADVHAALDGATPYNIDELVIDFDRNGGRTFIAAVARETLAEAEAFATEHQLAPVAFAAQPDPFTFQGDVFFGPTDAAKSAGLSVNRDSAATVITGTAVMPQAEPDPAQVVFSSRNRATPPPADVASPDPSHDDEITDLAIAQSPAAVPAPVIDDDAAPATPMAAPTLDTAAPAAMPAPPVPMTAPPRPDDMAASGGFRSRRSKGKAAKPAAAPKSAIRTKQAGPSSGKPRFLGLILTVILLLFMGVVALWASTIPLDDISRFFGFGKETPVEITLAAPDPPATQALAAAPQADAMVTAAATQPDDPSSRPLPQVTNVGRVLSPAEANRIYAVTGVWQKAPRFVLEPRIAPLSVSMPLAFEQPASTHAAILPDIAQTSPDLTYLPPSNPRPFGTTVPRDDTGMILATAQGIVTDRGIRVFAGTSGQRPQIRPRPVAQVTPQIAPDTQPAPADGVVVVSGRPDILPPARPATAAPAAIAEPVAVATVQSPRAGDPRPKLRPDGIAPAQLVTVRNASSADARPRLRPAGLAPVTTAAPETTADITSVVAAIASAAPESAFNSVSARAVRVSAVPAPRPRNFATVVAATRKNEAARAATRASAQTQQASSAPVAPSGPVPGGVARAATIENAIKLRNINLIGVSGKSNARRALIRLGNGQLVRVQVGSTLDGGRVTAISDSALNYVKRGKTIALKMPTG